MQNLALGHYIFSFDHTIIFGLQNKSRHLGALKVKKTKRRNLLYGMNLEIYVKKLPK